VLALASLLAGCATTPSGDANFSFASYRNYTKADGVEFVKHVERSMCSHAVLLLFGWGESPDHEYLIKTILEETGGDAITNAELEFSSLPLIVYMESCATVRGDVVRFRQGT
jgi:hypothetical protein